MHYQIRWQDDIGSTTNLFELIMKTLFITAIYNGLWGSKYGGRVGRDTMYLESLINTMRMGGDYVIYSSSEEIPQIESQIRAAVTGVNIKFIPYELRDCPFDADIFRILDGHNNTWPDRCYHLQYCKFIWLRNHLNENYDKIYWIDAGLSRDSLFPNRLVRNNPRNQYYDFTPFNENVLNTVNQMSDNGIFVFEKSMRDHALVDVKYLRLDYAEPTHIVGGWFGGSPQNVNQLIGQFMSTAELMLANNDLYSEEQIMTCIAAHKPEQFVKAKFDTWYHEDNDPVTNRPSTEVRFYDFFEKCTPK